MKVSIVRLADLAKDVGASLHDNWVGRAPTKADLAPMAAVIFKARLSNGYYDSFVK
jgi:hypothetical protein